MPAAVQKDRRVACHVCTNKDVVPTTTGLLRRHKNARGFVCIASNKPKQNRIRVVRSA